MKDSLKRPGVKLELSFPVYVLANNDLTPHIITDQVDICPIFSSRDNVQLYASLIGIMDPIILMFRTPSGLLHWMRLVRPWNSQVVVFNELIEGGCIHDFRREMGISEFLRGLANLARVPLYAENYNIRYGASVN